MTQRKAELLRDDKTVGEMVENPVWFLITGLSDIGEDSVVVFMVWRMVIKVIKRY